MTTIQIDQAYIIQMPSGKYYVRGEKEAFTETRVITYAMRYRDLDTAKKDVRMLGKGAKLIKQTRIARKEIGDEIEDREQFQGIERERKYVPANLGHYFYNDDEPAYAFASKTSYSNYLFGVHLLSYEEAKTFATQLEREEFEKKQKKVKWDVMEVAIIEEEVNEG